MVIERQQIVLRGDAGPSDDRTGLPSEQRVVSVQVDVSSRDDADKGKVFVTFWPMSNIVRVSAADVIALGEAVARAVNK